MNPSTILEYFQQLKDQQTFEMLQGTKIIGIDRGHLEVEFTTDTVKHANHRGDLHGAVHVGLSDSLMGTACFTLGKAVSTLEIAGNYVKPVKAGDTLRGVGRVEHNGKTTMVATCRMYNQYGELVYMGKGTFFVLSDFPIPELPWR